MNPKNLILSLVAAAVLPLAVTQADAATTLYLDAGPSAILQDFSGGNYVAGSEFTVSQSLQFNALGYLDAAGDGLIGQHQVGLWNFSGQTLIAQVTVDSSSTQVLSAQGTGMWYLEALNSTLTLAPGTYRVAGIVGNDGDEDSLSNNKIGNGVTISSGYVRTDFPNGGFGFPGLSFGSQAIRATVALTDAVNNSVPDAGSTMALFSIGLAGLAMMRRKTA